MSEITININGGNNQILLNATHAEQHFHYDGVEPPSDSTAAEVGKVVATMCENEPLVDSDRIIKGSFIKLLLPFLSNVAKGRGIDNLRCCINDAWTSRRKALRHAK